MKNRLSEMLLDDSGKVSAGRVLMLVLTVSYLCFAGYIVVTKQEMIDIPLGAGTLIAMLYGVNKFSPTYPFDQEKEKKVE